MRFVRASYCGFITIFLRVWGLVHGRQLLLPQGKPIKEVSSGATVVEDHFILATFHNEPAPSPIPECRRTASVAASAGARVVCFMPSAISRKVRKSFVVERKAPATPSVVSSQFGTASDAGCGRRQASPSLGERAIPVLFMARGVRTRSRIRVD
jgi:hypothetical protein